MNDNVFVSTNCFQGKDLENVLAQASDLEITTIELSSGLSSSGYDEKILERNSDKFRFIIHNYFLQLCVIVFIYD